MMKSSIINPSFETWILSLLITNILLKLFTIQFVIMSFLVVILCAKLVKFIPETEAQEKARHKRYEDLARYEN